MTGVMGARAARPDAAGVMKTRRRRRPKATPKRRTASRGPRPASPYAAFRRDHARLLRRLEALEATLSRRRVRTLRVAPLRALIAHLERQFATHMAAEEVVLFPALEHAFPESAGSLQPLYDEHVELREMLAYLARTLSRAASRQRDEQVLIQARDFVDLLRLHIRREEAVVFDVSERVLRAHELRGLARRLAPFIPASTPRPRAQRTPGSHAS
jgi:hemerythrin-like domain-containing protein